MLPIDFKFQSRNRGSFLFKHIDGDYLDYSLFQFQSRNRGSFLFKRIGEPCACSGIRHPFQSRNRGSFLFKECDSP